MEPTLKTPKKPKKPRSSHAATSRLAASGPTYIVGSPKRCCELQAPSNRYLRSHLLFLRFLLLVFIFNLIIDIQILRIILLIFVSYDFYDWYSYLTIHIIDTHILT